MTKARAASYDLRAPRYTSYPTAPHFSAAVTPEICESWLAALSPKTTLSLYAHILYCREMCWFCGCHAKVSKRYEPISAYLETLLDEVDLVASKLSCRFGVGHLHLGGGSPSVLTADDFMRLLDGFRRCFDFAEGAEIAVELDPRTTTDAYVQAMAKAGVTRVSLGVQDFNPSVQKAVNRLQPYEQVAKAVEQLRRHGIDALSMDLMYGLPHQSVESLLETIDAALTLQPGRISLFGYAHVPWMRKHQTLIAEETLPDVEVRWAQYEAAQARLNERGYVAIGLDHFARPDDMMARAWREKRLSRNFQGYTTDEAPALIGLGASGIGSLPQGYVANESDLHAWRRSVAAGILPIRRGVVLTNDDRVRRAVIEHLMCYLTVDVGDVAVRHGFFQDYFAQELASMNDLVRDGVIELEGSRIVVTPDNRLLVRVVAARFDAYFQAGEQRHAKAV